MVIYLIDDFNNLNSHGELMVKIITNYTQTQIKKIHIPKIINTTDLYFIFKNIYNLVNIDDIILIPWAKDSDNTLDSLVTTLAKKCKVIVSAGNSNKNIKDFSPTRADNIIVVGCLNKSLKKAMLSNYADYNIKWVVGTSYYQDNETHHGTSVSAAIYTAFLSNSLENNIDLDQQIENYHSQIKLIS